MLNLANLLKNLFQSLYLNQMEGNPEKCYLLPSIINKFTMNFYGLNIINSKSETLLGITIDSDISFQTQVDNLCKKASSKIHAPAQVARYLTIKLRRMVKNIFFNSQFGYWPLIWIFYGLMANNKIKKTT